MQSPEKSELWTTIDPTKKKVKFAKGFTEIFEELQEEVKDAPVAPSFKATD